MKETRSFSSFTFSLEEMADWFRSEGVTDIVMEATGNYWVALAVDLHEAGYRVAVVNPRQAHHFAKAQLRRAKTDALDARDLARLAAALRPGPWAPPPAVYHEVRQRLVARDGFLAMRTQVRNQRHALLQWPVVVEGVRQHLDGAISLTRPPDVPLAFTVVPTPARPLAVPLRSDGRRIRNPGLGRWPSPKDQFASLFEKRTDRVSNS